MFGQRPEDFDKVMDAPNPEAVVLTPVDLEIITAEYVARPPDLVVHLYRLGDWYWHNSDAQIIWEELVKGFRLEGEENKLLVEFIPEAYGWCISVKHVAAIIPPKHETIEAIIQAIEDRIKARGGG